MMVVMVVSGFLAVLAVAIVALLLWWSWPGKPSPFLDEGGRPLPGSISEKARAAVNGLEQGMFLRAKDRTRPVLLYLHGGMPEYFLTRRYPTGLETEFVVCWWEQRGAGLSYRPGMSPDSVNVEQLVADTLALTNHLRERFGRDRIYVMGHSGGSFLGMHAVARAPDLYHACAEASACVDRLTAPLKGVHTFSESAHGPLCEEPDEVMRILQEDVLHGTNRLADRT